jgi:hypothetical protein
MISRIPLVSEKKRKKRKEGRQLSIWLDQESVLRLEMLKGKLRRLDDSRLVAFALKCLEQQINRMAKRRVLKEIRALERKGLNPEQIAALLNEKGIPAPGQGNMWDGEIITRFSSRVDGKTPNKEYRLERRN